MIAGNVVTAGGTATAWYRLAPVSWNWRSEAERDGLIVAGAQVFAALTGHRLHFRVTSSTVTRQTWAARLSGDPASPLTGWAAHTDRCADHLAALDFHDKAAYVGVELRRRSSAGLWAGLWGRRQVDDVEAVVARPGFNAAPLSGDELEWLYRRSILLGHPAPTTSGIEGLWAEDDMPELDGSAMWTVEPYARSVRVTADGRTRHVVTSVIGRMQTLSSRDPWLCLTDRLPFDVEISATVDVLPAEQVQRGVRSMILRALSQREHYGEHQMPPPHTLQAGIDAALEVQAELDQGFGTDLSTRCDGWYRLAVAGDTEAEALARADQIKDLYAPSVTIWRPPAQYALAREFVPGAKLSSTAHRRRMPVTTAAGGMPQATAVVGHEAGWYLGWTSGAGGRRAVLWDPWRSPEQLDRSGLAVVVGQLGSGKSSLLGSLAYRSALAGVSTTVLDPSGPLAALCDLPELAGRSRHIDLLSSARPGMLNPWRLVPEPSRGHFTTEVEWVHARELAATGRRTLAADILLEMLPAVIREQPETLIAVRAACREASKHDWPSCRRVLDALHEAGKDDRHARVIGDLLGDLATLPAAALVFESGIGELDFSHLDEPPALSVITMRGLQVPREGSDRRDLSTDEVLSLPLLHLSAYLVQTTAYHGDRSSRKLLAFDEVHALSRIGSGRLLLNTSARDSRKHNVRVILCSQSAADLNEAGIANLIDAAFVGRTEDYDAQVEAVRLLRVPEGVGYEQALGSLSPTAKHRDFVFSDGVGGCEKVRVDLSVFPPHVREALNTTPTGVRANGKVPA